MIFRKKRVLGRHQFYTKIKNDKNDTEKNVITNVFLSKSVKKGLFGRKKTYLIITTNVYEYDEDLIGTNVYKVKIWYIYYKRRD